MRKLSLLALLVVLTAAFMAIVASPAFAKQIHVFKSSFGSGELENPFGVAVSEIGATEGFVYVVNQGDASVKIFDSAGSPKGEFDGSGTAEFEGLTTIGTPAAEGALENPTWIAIDNNPLSPSAGDVYVADNGHGVIDKFEADGTYLGQISAGESGNPFGEIYGLALDPEGEVWVFQQSGEIDNYTSAKANAFGSSCADPRGTNPGLAVDSADNIYVNTGEERFAKLDSSCFELIFELDAEPQKSSAAAVDPASDDVYVDDRNNIGLFDPGADLLERFGSEQLSEGAGLALNSAPGQHLLYVADRGTDSVHVYGQVTVPDVSTEPATDVEAHRATLHGTVNPAEAGEATCRFAWGTTTALTETPVACPATVADGNTFVPVEAALAGLQPNTTYFYRLEAENASGLNPGEPTETRKFTTPGPAEIAATFATEVSADAATLSATITVHGLPATYRFEYDTAPYGEAGPPHGTRVPIPAGALGSGQGPVEVSQRLQDLAAATTYHYRVLTSAEVEPGIFEEIAGPDRAFTTQTPAILPLPDQRGWELVSPPGKRGASLLPIAETGVIQAAADGGALTYLATAPTEADPPGYSNNVQILSTRRPGGWSSLDLPVAHRAATQHSVGGGQEYRFFSSDLSRALLQPFALEGSFTPLSPDTSEPTPYLRSDFAAPGPFCTDSCFRPLVSGCPGSGEACPGPVEEHADVPPGTVFGRQCFALSCGAYFRGASPDLAHVILESHVGLTATAGDEGGLYEYSADSSPAEALRLISVLPGGERAPFQTNPVLGFRNEVARDAVSADGSRVVWSEESGEHHLYLRLNATETPSAISGSAVDGSQCTEPAQACTIQLDAVQGGPGAAQPADPAFQAASSDGSRIFFTDSQQLSAGSGVGSDLYECQLVESGGYDKCALTDLTPQLGGESAELQGQILGASADGSDVYFVANGALAPGSGPGDCVFNGPATESCNLYRRHAGTTTFIATLSAADAPDWASLKGHTSRVSPNGRWLAFMSQRPLTGYDNRDAVSGVPDQEVFLYDAAADGGEGRLLCASCNPTGARPHGREYGKQEQHFLYGGDRVWPESGTWLAANVPGWTSYAVSEALYQPRYLSDSGRLFFNSGDGLVPADTNGKVDVYQYEPPSSAPEPPTDDTCTTASPTYSSASKGCVGLISSGTSDRESGFLDASASGDNVFFLTYEKLTTRDTDSSLDAYDARVGGGEAEPIKPVECSGDACQQPAIPPVHPTPGTALLNGPGNFRECPKGKVKRTGKCDKRHKAKKRHRHHKKAKQRRAKVNRGSVR